MKLSMIEKGRTLRGNYHRPRDKPQEKIAKGLLQRNYGAYHQGIGIKSSITKIRIVQRRHQGKINPNDQSQRIFKHPKAQSTKMGNTSYNIATKITIRWKQT